jgi:hypothetical protein
MPELTLVKTGKGTWAGLTAEDVDKYRKFKRWRRGREAGEFFTMSYDYERDSLHHRKFMALVTYVAQNSDVYDNKDKALIAIKIAAGHCDFVHDPRTGQLVAIPKSISFKKMKQGAFEEFYEGAIQAVITHILPHMNRVALDDALDVVSRF